MERDALFRESVVRKQSFVGKELERRAVLKLFVKLDKSLYFPVQILQFLLGMFILDKGYFTLLFFIFRFLPP